MVPKILVRRMDVPSEGEEGAGGRKASFLIVQKRGFERDAEALGSPRGRRPKKGPGADPAAS